MKKVSISILFLFLFLPINSYGQFLSGFGIKMGVGFSNQHWEYLLANGQTVTSTNSNNYNSFVPRLFVDLFSIPFLNIEAELGYMKKGVKQDDPIIGAAQRNENWTFTSPEITLDYLSVSTLAKFKYNLAFVSPYIIIGPQLNFLINKNHDRRFAPEYENFAKNNIGFSLGAGAELINVLPFSILVEYRYERDLKENDESPYFKVKNFSHVILIGMKF